MSVESPEQLRGLQRAGRVVAETLRVLRRAVAPGVTTAELDRLAAETFARLGARSGPILTYGYPGFVCISVEDQVVHGVPGPRVLRPGQLVTLDVAAEVAGYHADAAITIPVARVDPGRQRLMDATRAALNEGIRAARPGATLRDVGAAIEREARRRRFTVLRELTGHGIGLAMHEDPTVFNWPAPAARTRLTSGLVFTIEPMLTSGGPGLVLEDDGWTVRTADRALSAHQEHTIMVSRSGRPVVLTAA
jgi:methionyl aminopeptidase